MPAISGYDMRLSVDQLFHQFGTRDSGEPPVLDIDQLGAESGRFALIAGPSGSGKSTLLYVLSGLLKPSRGEICWDGKSISSLSETARDVWRRNHAGFVFQNFHLIPEMTALQNVTIPAYFSRWSARDLRGRAVELLSAFEVPITARSVQTYSRGEQQRVALARALIFNPAIIFADEPTASLDEKSAANIAMTLSELATKQGKTIIAVSHDPAMMELADEIIQIDHGHVLEHATKRAS